jgi:hypothetical protein
MARAQTLLKRAVGDEEYEWYEKTGGVRFPCSQDPRLLYHVTCTWVGIYLLEPCGLVVKKKRFIYPTNILHEEPGPVMPLCFEDRVISYMLRDEAEPNSFFHVGCEQTWSPEEAEEIVKRGKHTEIYPNSYQNFCTAP